VVTFSVGEVLQVTARAHEACWVRAGWHTRHGFAMPYWKHLQQQDQFVFLQLRCNHRLSGQQADLLQRVSGWRVQSATAWACQGPTVRPLCRGSCLYFYIMPSFLPPTRYAHTPI
jgi:hypothetical protein